MRIITSLLLSIATALPISAQTDADTRWTTPDIHVEGNHLVDATGKQVMLHGIMDTPSPYFCGYRFTDGHWIDVYNQGDAYISKCITYFNNLFNATAGTKRVDTDSWCNVFRLHLDPCWTDNPTKNASGFTTTNGKTYDPNGNEVSGEADIQHFDRDRLQKYLDKLYIPIAQKAQAHGMYVIMRPPGVCPNTIKVGDYYQKFLIDVWDIVTKNQTVLDNSGWLSIELANEPINIRTSSGGTSVYAKRDFFQPIVDKIRANGFKGIIWIPGEIWQQDYKSYANYPIKDKKIEGYEDEQFGYAVHWYPGWYSTSDTSYDKKRSLNAFLGSVPVAKTKPIMITEVDWSPEDPTGQGHTNESGQWVVPNCGTWATGTTSKFGEAFKYVIDYLGNCGMTLTHTHDYLDIDYYLNNGKARPAFYTKLNNNPWEACSGACWQWYKEWAHEVHQARDWNASIKYKFDEANELKDMAANLNGKTLAFSDETAKNIWYVNENMDGPQDVKQGTLEDLGTQNYTYLKFTKVTSPGCSTTGNLYLIQFADEMGSNYNLWGAGGYFNAQPSGNTLFALNKSTDKYTYGTDANYGALWKITYEEGHGYVFQNVCRLEKGVSSYVYPTASTPQSEKGYVRLFSKITEVLPTEIKNVIDNDKNAEVIGIFDMSGRKMQSLQKGINIIRYSNGLSKKIIRK